MLPARRISVGLLTAAAFAVVSCSGGGVDSPTASTPVKPFAWVEGTLTQPIPSWGSSVRLALPVPLGSIVLGPGGGLGAFGGHQGGHTEGLNHVWIPTTGTITTVGSWADGTVTKIEDTGAFTPGNPQHEYFVTVDYGNGLVGKHLDATQVLVTLGAHVKQGDPVVRGATAEFMLIDNNRTDGERSGPTNGSFVSPFDYLRDADKNALIARFQAEVIAPWFSTGKSAGNSRPWEPALTNPSLFHARQMGTVAGEWILTNKGWHSTPDPSYYDLMTIFDVTNSYGHWQRIEAGDHDWSLPGNKNNASASWTAPDGPGTMIVTFFGKPAMYARYSTDDTGTRSKLTIKWKAGSYPASISAAAAVYVTRSATYLGADAALLGLIP